MLNNNKKPVFIFIILTAVFLIGITKLFLLRFESGDIYPPYSSLRADPLGTKAFYASLEHLDRFDISRNFLPLNAIKNSVGTTFFYIGANIYEWDFFDKKTLAVFDQIAAEGGRVVICFFPTKPYEPPSFFCEPKPDKFEKDSDEKSENENTEDNHKSLNKTEHKTINNNTECERSHIAQHWKFDFAFEKESDGNSKAISNNPAALPPTVSRTTLYFKDLQKRWRTIYSRNGHPVIIERNLGTGTIVLTADSYFLSNEALRNERSTELLAWAVGNNSRIIFDESHFGIQKHTGLIDLITKYHFQWILIGSLVFAGLFIWKNAVSFVPPVENVAYPGANNVAAKHDHAEGLTSLLRRNIKLNVLLTICANEWQKSFVSKTASSSALKEKWSKINSMINTYKLRTEGMNDPVAVYQSVCRMLSKKDFIK